MRAAVDDLMQGFRFHVTAADENNANPLEFNRQGEFEGGGQAGFQSVTLPEVSVEAVEYREGTFEWTQKYPGPPTVSECTLMRGLSKEDNTFHHWVMASIEGDAYRADVTIWHYQRTEMGYANQSETGDNFRRVECHNAFAMRAKPGADFDSMSGEVSLAEVDFAMESFEVLYS
jgi:phage tail-like protein